MKEKFKPAKRKLRLMISILLMAGIAAVFLTGYHTSEKKHSTHHKETALPDPAENGRIFLYGESHGIKSIMDQELQLWETYYKEEGMRDLFIEYPYFTAEFLNVWMQSEDDKILEELYDEALQAGRTTAYIWEFFQTIKLKCPKTVFHGTDVGHQYNSTGKRYLEYLRDNGQENSEKYALAEEAIEQGRYYNSYSAEVYRENKMTENFIREFEKLDGADVMGIYGSAHTGLNEMDYYTHTVPNMGNQLRQHYGKAVASERLLDTSEKVTVADMKPLRTDTLRIKGKDYKASYFGKEDLSKIFHQYQYREFWRLEDEDAYKEFKKHLTTGQILPYTNYPMKIEKGQVFVVDYMKTDGSVERTYYRNDGMTFGDTHGDQCPVTEEFFINLWTGMR